MRYSFHIDPEKINNLCKSLTNSRSFLKNKGFYQLCFENDQIIWRKFADCQLDLNLVINERVLKEISLENYFRYLFSHFDFTPYQKLKLYLKKTYKNSIYSLQLSGQKSIGKLNLNFNEIDDYDGQKIHLSSDSGRFL